MSDAPSLNESKEFQEWLGKVISAKTESPSALQKRLQDLHGKHQAAVEQARKAEADLAQAKGLIIRLEGAAEQLVELLKEEFDGAQGGPAADAED